MNTNAIGSSCFSLLSHVKRNNHRLGCNLLQSKDVMTMSNNNDPASASLMPSSYYRILLLNCKCYDVR